MKFSTTSEGIDWLKTRGIGSIARPALTERLVRDRAFRVPGDSGRKTALARELSRLLVVQQDELLLWISGYGIWPSSENQELFYAYRASLGERRPLGDVPCHLLQAHDVIVLECLLDLVLYFCWDATVVNGTGDAAVSADHDEILTIRTTDEARGREFDELLGRMKIGTVPA